MHCCLLPGDRSALAWLRSKLGEAERGGRLSSASASWLPAPSKPVDGVYLYSTGEAVLKRKEDGIGGVPLKRIAEIIQVGEKGYDEQKNGLFGPLIQFPEGRRSFLPGDLDDAEESPLRQLAEQCDDPIVRGRIYEVLLARFPARRREYQPLIVTARLASLPFFDGWPEQLNTIARASVLVIQAKDDAQLRAVLDGWDLVGTSVLASEYWFAFARVAVAFATHVLKQRWARPRVEAPRLERWDVTARWHAHRSISLDHFQRQMVLDEVGDWCGAVGDGAGKLTYHREQVEDILMEAEERGGLVATSLLSRALKLAADRGGEFKDLALKAKRAFPEAMKQGEAEFKPYQMELRVPEPIMAYINEILERSPSVQVVLQSLAAFPLVMELSKEHIEASAKKSMEHFIGWRVFPSVAHRDGKIVAVSSSDADHLREQMALVSRLHIGTNEVILRYVLAKIFDRINPSDLYDLVSGCPGLDRRRIPFLETASERFKAQDWVSCGVITSVMYESVLRDFVRSTGYPARQVEADGVHADQTLGDMLRAAEVRHVLGDQHADMVTHVLLDPERGMNLRNDVGHGTAHAGALTPERILLVWLFLVRLTLIRPITEEDEDHAPADKTDHSGSESHPGQADSPPDSE